VLAFNREIDEATAMQITEPNRFIECIIARATATRPSEC
jgi:AICAR transformylase/IMP cyclohydrolase PurH